MTTGTELDMALQNIRHWVGMPQGISSYLGDSRALIAEVRTLGVRVHVLEKVLLWVEATHPEIIDEYQAVQDVKASCDES